MDVLIKYQPLPWYDQDSALSTLSGLIALGQWVSKFWALDAFQLQEVIENAKNICLCRFYILMFTILEVIKTDKFLKIFI